MIKFVIFLVTVASIQANVISRSEELEHNTGWTTTVSPPVTTPGWSVPSSSSDWVSGIGVNINLSGGLSAVAAGTAIESHTEDLEVTGDDEISAELVVSTGGESILTQDESMVQLTNNDPESVFTLNSVSVNQIAVGGQGLGVYASGENVLVGQGGLASAAGEGLSVVAADAAVMFNN